MNGRRRGFTLIELMIVVAIIGLLAAIAVPRFGALLRKANEGRTKGNLGAVRSALKIYYADNNGVYPAGAASTNITYLQTVLTLDGKYLSKWPSATAPDYHSSTSSTDGLDDIDAQGADPTDDGEWLYVGNRDDRDWGHFFVECYHTDSSGTVWTEY